MRPVQYFIIIDHVALTAGNSTIEAFDKLFKCFYTFQLSYPMVIQSFWEFIDTMVYECMDACKATPHVREVGCAVRSMMADD